MADAAALTPTHGLGQELGCPSGLLPADATGVVADPTPFVRIDRQGQAVLELSVKGAKCAGCMAKIERGLMATPGMVSARLNLSTQRLSVAWTPGAVSPPAVIATLNQLGYAAAPFDPEAGRIAVDAEGAFLLRCLGVAAFASMNIMLLSVSVWAGFGEMQPGTRALLYAISGLIAIPAALYAAQPFFRSAWSALRVGRANMDVPISLAVCLTLGVSIYETFNEGLHAYFDGVVMLLFLLLIGRVLDHQLRERARTAAKELLALQATTATRLLPDGSAEVIAARSVKVGDLLLLAAGDRAPVDGFIEEGQTEIDRSLVTGESAPHSVGLGDLVHAGVVNLTRPVRLRAHATADASTVAELARLIEAGEQRRAGQVRLADKAARLYVPVVHTLAAATLLGWLFIGGVGFREALMNAVAVLIITCPCALALAVPAVQVVATGRLFKAGVFVKSGDALERLASIDRVRLDKTGTVTIGRPVLLNGAGLDPATLSQAALLARASRHPLARALAQAAGRGPVAVGAEEVPGQGVRALLDGQPARLGRRSFVAPASSGMDEPGSELLFQVGEGPLVRFAFADALRPDARRVMDDLGRLGLDPALLSGDRPQPVAEAAEALGLKEAHAGLTPAEKITALEALRANGHRVLMVGDGLNDAAALAAAHVSASPGTAIDATQAAADFVIQGDSMAGLTEAIDVSRQAHRRVLENFAFTAVYNALAVPLAAAGFVTPLIAALAMAGSSLIVTLNALRLARRSPT